MPNMPLMAFYEGFLALGLGGGDPIFLGERPASQQGGCTVLTPMPVPADSDLPLEGLAVRIVAYHSSQQTAFTRAGAVYQALHRRLNWSLTDWQALLCTAEHPPIHEDALETQGGRCYRAALTLRLVLKPVPPAPTIP